MKNIYLSLLLLAPGFMYADDVQVVEQDAVVEQKDEAETEQLQEVLAENNEVQEDQERAMFDLDDDDFFGDSLDKMIEMGAVDEEAEVKPMPLWKVWFLRVGSSVMAKLEAFKLFVTKRYNDAKYIVAAAWAKARGKKLPKRPKIEKKNKKRNSNKKQGTHAKQS